MYCLYGYVWRMRFGVCLSAHDQIFQEISKFSISSLFVRLSVGVLSDVKCHESRCFFIKVFILF